ncbi:hypothetical protein EIL50_04235 [bacterium NHP-B]|nr:hypothetical protein EIL50_04235 [bacterium NHP-B]
MAAGDDPAPLRDSRLNVHLPTAHLTVPEIRVTAPSIAGIEEGGRQAATLPPGVQGPGGASRSRSLSRMRNVFGRGHRSVSPSPQRPQRPSPLPSSSSATLPPTHPPMTFSQFVQAPETVVQAPEIAVAGVAGLLGGGGHGSVPAVPALSVPPQAQPRFSTISTRLTSEVDRRLEAHPSNPGEHIVWGALQRPCPTSLGVHGGNPLSDTERTSAESTSFAALVSGTDEHLAGTLLRGSAGSLPGLGSQSGASPLLERRGSLRRRVGLRPAGAPDTGRWSQALDAWGREQSVHAAVVNPIKHALWLMGRPGGGSRDAKRIKAFRKGFNKHLAIFEEEGHSLASSKALFSLHVLTVEAMVFKTLHHIKQTVANDSDRHNLNTGFLLWAGSRMVAIERLKATFFSHEGAWDDPQNCRQGFTLLSYLMNDMGLTCDLPPGYQAGGVEGAMAADVVLGPENLSAENLANALCTWDAWKVYTSPQGAGARVRGLTHNPISETQDALRTHGYLH